MKKNLTKGMAMGMVMTILAGTTAFANEAVTEPLLISENPNADKTIESVIAGAEASMYLTQEGTVASVETSATEGVSIVTIDNEKTPIANMQGSRIRLTDADVKGQDALVFYDMMTKSLPAQVNPSFVLILGEQAAPAVSVPLRETAEANGFKVAWTGKNRPVVVANEAVTEIYHRGEADREGEISMNIYVGETKYFVNGEEREASMPAELIDGVLYVSSEIFE